MAISKDKVTGTRKINHLANSKSEHSDIVAAVLLFQL